MHNTKIPSPEPLIEMLKSSFFTFFLMYHPQNSTHGILNIYEQSIVTKRKKKTTTLFELSSHCSLVCYNRCTYKGSFSTQKEAIKPF